jgi:hypothetical protein
LSLRWVNAPEPITWSQRVPYSVHDEFSFYPTSVLGIVIPGIFRHTDPFIGLVVVTLAVIGAVAGWQKPVVRIFLALAALAALVLACVYLAWSRTAIPNGWASGLLILLMLVELGNVSTAGYQPLAKPLWLNKLYQNQDIAQYLRTRGEPVRVSVDSEDIPYNFGDWFGIDQAGGCS